MLIELPINPEYEAVLASGTHFFIQARGEVSEDWADGATDGLILHAMDGRRHVFESGSRHPPATVIRIFQLYAQGNPQWRQEIEWKEFKPAGPTLLIFGGILVAAIVLWRLLR